MWDMIWQAFSQDTPFSASPAPLLSTVPVPSIPNLFQGAMSWLCLELSSSINGLQFSLVCRTTHKSITIYQNAFWFPRLYCCVCLSCYLYIQDFAFQKTSDILVEFLMGLAVNKCDEFSVLNCQSSESILFFDNLTFHILTLRSSNCKCNTIRVKNELLFID